MLLSGWHETARWTVYSAGTVSLLPTRQGVLFGTESGQGLQHLVEEQSFHNSENVFKVNITVLYSFSALKDYKLEISVGYKMGSKSSIIYNLYLIIFITLQILTVPSYISEKCLFKESKCSK